MEWLPVESSREQHGHATRTPRVRMQAHPKSGCTWHMTLCWQPRRPHLGGHSWINKDRNTSVVMSGKFPWDSLKSCPGHLRSTHLLNISPFSSFCLFWVGDETQRVSLCLAQGGRSPSSSPLVSHECK